MIITVLVLAFVTEFSLESLSADTTQRQDALSAEVVHVGCGNSSLPVVGQVTCGQVSRGRTPWALSVHL